MKRETDNRKGQTMSESERVYRIKQMLARVRAKDEPEHEVRARTDGMARCRCGVTTFLDAQGDCPRCAQGYGRFAR
jgi:hypothetical protein